MGGPDLPEIPAPLKSIQHYLKIASTHDQRDVVVSYWCRLYALQTGLKLSTKTTEETNFLLKLMDWLEATKKELRDNEAISNDVAAQAHLENWALKLFLFADQNDRASNFGKNVVQSFYTAGILYDVLTVFGELSVEAMQNAKYAKWKASYIHNCLKNGETPVAGPLTEENNSFDDETAGTSVQPRSETNTSDFPAVPLNVTDKPNQIDESGTNITTPIDDNQHNPLSDLTNIGSSRIPTEECNATVNVEGENSLSVDQVAKAQKYIKWAGSALDYDDIPTSITNLRKALHLLTTGKDPA